MTTRVPRFFVEGVQSVGAIVRLDAADHHKAQAVLRLEEGDDVELCDSAGRTFIAATLDMGGELQFVVRELEREPRIDRVAVTLAQCLPKASKMDYVVEKAVELGVEKILPVHSARVQGEVGRGTKLDRWRRVAKSAALQCGAATIPDVGEIVDWSQVLDLMPTFDRVLLPWELCDTDARRLEGHLADVRRVLVIIGPEGGITQAEADGAIAKGAVPISLGERILRTETAGLVAIALIHYAASTER